MPREGHDFIGMRTIKLRTPISIHVPREGHDEINLFADSSRIAFQSTCPARGTTTLASWNYADDYISIHVPREGHDHNQGDSHGTYRKISIHVPREGHDGAMNTYPYTNYQFQSTCPARGTTSRTACIMLMVVFQSTCPARGTTVDRERNNIDVSRISIHVPREGHDGS